MNGSAVTVANSSFRSNSSAIGGAISAQFGSVLSINRSEFVANSATEEGGAIIIDGNTIVRASSFVDNSGDNSGGAVIAQGSFEIENSTFYGNALSSDGEFGAAIGLFGAIATLRHVTIAESQAPLLASYNSRLYMVNSVIAGGKGDHLPGHGRQRHRAEYQQLAGVRQLRC